MGGSVPMGYEGLSSPYLFFLRRSLKCVPFAYQLASCVWFVVQRKCGRAVVKIVSLITCEAAGLSYVGVTKNVSNFGPPRCGFGRPT
jgi:hypothetical protein